MLALAKRVISWLRSLSCWLASAVCWVVSVACLALKRLSDKERMGCVFWTDLLRKHGQRTSLLSHLAPASPEDPVADQLIAAVQVATAIDNKVRSMDSLSLYLGFASCLSEKDRPCAHAVFTM